MNIKTNPVRASVRAAFLNVTLVSSVLLLAACAEGPTKDPGADRVRADLTTLQSNPELASRAPIAMKDAEQSVRDAEIPDVDPALTAHRVYIADRKVQTAKSLAQEQYAMDQRKALSDKGDQVRLDARTHEADAAKRKNDDLLAQLADLKAKKTDAGVQITLGDVLFSSGRAELKAGSAINLDKLVVALGQAPDRHVVIDGYTDSQGADDYNMTLSQKRADSVSLYLTGHGVDFGRITATGKGESFPVAANETAEGRQLNRRVEVTIQNPPQ